MDHLKFPPNNLPMTPTKLWPCSNFPSHFFPTFAHLGASAHQVLLLHMLSLPALPSLWDLPSHGYSLPGCSTAHSLLDGQLYFRTAAFPSILCLQPFLETFALISCCPYLAWDERNSRVVFPASSAHVLVIDYNKSKIFNKNVPLQESLG